MIRAIITDFDGTLVDTFEANFRAYQKAFSECGIVLTAEKYRECFGLRYDGFMSSMGIADEDVVNKIKELKKNYYPMFFECLIPNYTLIDMINTFHQMGGKTAIASTARKENLMSAVGALDLQKYFDVILTGVDVEHGKPEPEIYNKTMTVMGVTSKETLIFEDSDIGIGAAIASGAKYIRVTPEWFEYGRNENS
ncbi:MULTISPECIES: HAD family hydrolase [Bacteroides]|uniref:HAD family hydrolase n=1 Tax=Bacteroides TaxID=816 RepID=UPI0023F9DECF|nr:MULTISPECIES: HAD-IA family hydrolase [Bacteroides]